LELTAVTTGDDPFDLAVDIQRSGTNGLSAIFTKNDKAGEIK
jgi:hypothetical protein